MVIPNMPSTVHRLLILAVTLLCFGCSPDPVSLQNYEQIETGMTQAQVYDLLGEPDTVDSMELGGYSGTLASWEGRRGTITVQLFNDQVWGKQYASKDGKKTPEDTRRQ